MKNIRKQTYTLEQYLKDMKAEKSEQTRNVRDYQDNGIQTW